MLPPQRQIPRVMADRRANTTRASAVGAHLNRSADGITTCGSPAGHSIEAVAPRDGSCPVIYRLGGAAARPTARRAQPLVIPPRGRRRPVSPRPTLKCPRAPSPSADGRRGHRLSTRHRPARDGHGCNRRPSCVRRHRFSHGARTAARTTRPRTASMKSVKNKRAAAGDTATTLPDGITTFA